jgi:putative SOS response-associated peptidase YedK
MKWGLVPTWARDENIGYRMINARAEGIFDKPAWRGPIRRHRCLVPASGFYEWQEQPNRSAKQPYYIFPNGEEMFAFAGIYEVRTDDEGGELWTYAIVTTKPNAEMAELHDRMPVILHPEDWDTWLDPSLQDEGPLMELLKPYDGDLELYEVSTDVNATYNNDRHLVYPLHPV